MRFTLGRCVNLRDFEEGSLALSCKVGLYLQFSRTILLFLIVADVREKRITYSL
jgi:hypothetical protein